MMAPGKSNADKLASLMTKREVVAAQFLSAFYMSQKSEDVFMRDNDYYMAKAIEKADRFLKSLEDKHDG